MSRFDRPAASLKTDSQFVSFTTGARIFTAVKLEPAIGQHVDHGRVPARHLRRDLPVVGGVLGDPSASRQ